MAETVNFSLRLPVDLASAISSRAAAVGCTKAEAMCHYVRLGIQADAGCSPATREDLAALRDQVAALGEFQRAQSIALMDGVRGAIASMPVPVLPSGVPESEARRMVDEARAEAEAASVDEIERLQGLLADERELSHSLGEQMKSMKGEFDAERERMADEFEKESGRIGYDGYIRGIEDCRKAGLVKRVLGHF